MAINRDSKLFSSKLFFYILLFPYLQPEGCGQFLIYSSLIKVLLLMSMMFSVVLFIKNPKLGKLTKWIVIYHFILIMTTCVLQGGFSDGLKKMFAVPCMCILYDKWYKNKSRVALEGTFDILFILEVVNILTWGLDIFSSDVTFLGIRTLYPNIGFLAIFVAILIIKLQIPNYKIRAYMLILMVLVSILVKWVSTGITALLILGGILLLTGKSKWVNRFSKSINFLILGIILNVSVVFFRIQDVFSGFIEVFLHKSISLTGRTYIWDLTLEAIKNHLFCGYGVYGKFIEMPDSWGGVAFNYVHTQSLQLLLDGGIIALLSFIFILYWVAKNIDQSKWDSAKRISAIILFCYVVMMITEVCSSYFYFWGFIIAASNIDRIRKSMKIEENIERETGSVCI